MYWIMKISTTSFLLFILLISFEYTAAQGSRKYGAIYSGVPWFDDRGNPVSAHGANIVREDGRFYLFGEAHTDTSNAFAGFNCHCVPNWSGQSQANNKYCPF